MEVALLHPYYWPEVRRGSERVVHDLAAGLSAAGHGARVVTTHAGRRATTAVEDGVTVRRLGRAGERLVRWVGLPEPAAQLPFAWRELHRSSPDVAHAFYVGEGLAALAWARRTGRPAVFSAMGLPRPEGIAGRPRALAAARRVMRGADAVVAISAAVAEGVRRHLGGSPRVIHPGVDLRTFSPGGERAREPTVYCAAALEDPRKQAEVLLGAFARVRHERPGARLVLERPRDAALAGRLARTKGVELVEAARDDATLVARYRAAWASVLPSRAEAFGLVLAEGLACGTPGVGTREGGITEILDDDATGRLFAPGDEAALARALLEALELAGRPATAAACRAHAARFDQEHCVREHVALYRSLGVR